MLRYEDLRGGAQAHLASGYELLFTPHMASIDLWKTSGHFDFYKDGMFDQAREPSRGGSESQGAVLFLMPADLPLLR